MRGSRGRRARAGGGPRPKEKAPEGGARMESRVETGRSRDAGDGRQSGLTVCVGVKEGDEQRQRDGWRERGTQKSKGRGDGSG